MPPPVEASALQSSRTISDGLVDEASDRSRRDCGQRFYLGKSAAGRSERHSSREGVDRFASHALIASQGLADDRTSALSSQCPLRHPLR
jgi:hypothetical protein